ncbi:MAG: hypothetical protein KDA41_19530 [Planctomycetales bacterium]|nr:hypothetical protein [Planctomycetales bacterium]
MHHTTTARRTALAAAAALLAALVGCGGESYPMAPVSGRVTLDGQPLAGARVGFEPRRQGESPNAGPGSYATTDADGRFELVALTGAKGAVVATHDVRISTVVLPAQRGEDLAVAVPEKVPPCYNDETTLTFDVPAKGAADADFALSTSIE